MKRSLAPLTLKNSPLVLVLCQVRISSVLNISNYVPEIQDVLRKKGFPIYVGGEIVEFSVQAQSDEPVQQRKQAHWEFRTSEEDWSIIVGKAAIVVQTTAYSNFEKFLENLSTALGAIVTAVGDLLVERVGLRYVDAIRPSENKTWRDYVKAGFHGQENEIVTGENSVLFMQTVVDTGSNQRMIIRLAQNRDGALLPPDLSLHPRLQDDVREGELITLLDIDHYREYRQTLSVDDVIGTSWELHDKLDIIFREIVTDEALEAWK